MKTPKEIFSRYDTADYLESEANIPAYLTRALRRTIPLSYWRRSVTWRAHHDPTCRKNGHDTHGALQGPFWQRQSKFCHRLQGCPCSRTQDYGRCQLTFTRLQRFSDRPDQHTCPPEQAMIHATKLDLTDAPAPFHPPLSSCEFNKQGRPISINDKRMRYHRQFRESVALFRNR